MKLRDRAPGTRVAIRQNVVETGTGGKRNTYDLIISVGKGKAKAMLLASRIQKFLEELAD